MENRDENKADLSYDKKTSLSRVVIYPKDIQVLTGKSYRHALYLQKDVRHYFAKKKHQLLTIYEFAEYTGISLEAIGAHIR